MIPFSVKHKILTIAPQQLRRSRVRENKTPMVRLSELKCIALEKRFYLRAPEAEMLAKAAYELHKIKTGYTLLVRDAWRSMKDQKSVYEADYRWWRKRHPEWNHERLYREVTKFVADPKHSFHPSGATVDITIVDASGNELDMGVHEETLRFANVKGTFMDERDSLLSKNVPPHVRKNRLLLATVMTKAGFTLQKEEWWHFDGKNRAYAVATGRTAPYGDVKTPKDVKKMLVRYKGFNFVKRIPRKIRTMDQYNL